MSRLVDALPGMDARKVTSMPVISRRKAGGVIMLRLPEELRTDIDGGCVCEFCRAHPDRVPQWDTLCVATGRPARGADVSWTCHNPEGR